MQRRELILPTLFSLGVGLGATLLSLFVLANFEEPKDVVGVFAPLVIGQIATAIGILCLDGLLFGKEPHSGSFALWSFGLTSAAAVVIVGLGLWHATWPYHLAAIVPLAVTAIVLRGSRHIKRGASSADTAAESEIGQQ